MYQDLDSSISAAPSNMDVNNVKTRGLNSSNSSNQSNDKTSSTRPKGQNRRLRDHHPNGAASGSSNSGYYADNPRRFKGGQGGRKHHQQRSSALSMSTSSSKPSHSEFNAEVMKEDEFEVGSVFNAGSKKQNLNHLLNFQFEPRGSKSKNHQGSSGSRVRKFSDSKGRPKYNKEQYLQAK